jgi:Domain of unknown function (DUF4168)
VVKLAGSAVILSIPINKIIRNLSTVKYFKHIVPQTFIRSIGLTPRYMTTPHTHILLHRLSRPLLVSTIASLLTILVGIIPNPTGQTSSIFSNAAQADDSNPTQRRTYTNRIEPLRQQKLAQGGEEFSDTELRNYAMALMQIEPIRQSTLSQVIRANGGGTLPNLVCNQPSTMDGLNSEAKSLFIRYCNQSEGIAASKGLNIEKFNQITQSVRSNPQLQNRVRAYMN